MSYKVETCGEKRNSFSKTDVDATFMRIKTDYMGNDQLLPAYNLQFGICDEYIAVADAGYGSQNNYIFCENNGMEKYMKFPMYKKETIDTKYQSDIFRPINFKRNENNELICPNNKAFKFLYRTPIRGNKFGREQEVFECENCFNCPFKSMCHKKDGNRRININQELDSFHQEVINNLQSVHGALLRMNRSIQSEGTFGIIKQNRNIKRIVRKGLKAVNTEIFLLSIGYNLMKYHNKKYRTDLCC